MHTTFRLNDSSFSGALRLTVGAESWVFDREVTVELPDTPSLSVTLALAQTDEQLQAVRNPLLRGLLRGLFWLFSSLAYALDSSDGAKPDSFLPHLCPFRVCQQVHIADPADKTVSVTVTEGTYARRSRLYTPPQLAVEGEGITVTGEDTRFDEQLYRQQWRQSYIPGFVLLYLLIGFLLFVSGAVLLQVVRRFPASPPAEGITELVLAGLICLLLLGLTAALTYWVVIRAIRLARVVLQESRPVEESVLPNSGGERP